MEITQEFLEHQHKLFKQLIAEPEPFRLHTDPSAYKDFYASFSCNALGKALMEKEQGDNIFRLFLSVSRHKQKEIQYIAKNSTYNYTRYLLTHGIVVQEDDCYRLGSIPLVHSMIWVAADLSLNKEGDNTSLSAAELEARKKKARLFPNDTVKKDWDQYLELLGYYYALWRIVVEAQYDKQAKNFTEELRLTVPVIFFYHCYRGMASSVAAPLLTAAIPDEEKALPMIVGATLCTFEKILELYEEEKQRGIAPSDALLTDALMEQMEKEGFQLLAITWRYLDPTTDPDGSVELLEKLITITKDEQQLFNCFIILYMILESLAQKSERPLLQCGFSGRKISRALDGKQEVPVSELHSLQRFYTRIHKILTFYSNKYSQSDLGRLDLNYLASQYAELLRSLSSLIEKAERKEQ